MSPTTFAVIGLGEAGRTFAAGLAPHATVIGWDPFASPELPGVRIATSTAECIDGADAILTFTTAAHSAEALDGVLDSAAPGTIYADFATAGPADKRALARTAGEASLRFVDAAIMAPVRRGAAEAPIYLAGDAADELAGMLTEAGLQAQVLEGPPGTAAGRKLVRSMLVKGLTGVMIESLRAAAAEGLLDWFSDHLVETLTELSPEALSGFLDGTRQHSFRRIEEMEAAADMAEQAGVSAGITRAVVEVLRSVESDGIPVAGELA